MLLGAFDVPSLNGIDADAIALVDEWGNLDGNAIFEGRWLVDIGNGGALKRRFSLGHRQFQRRRQVDSNGRAFVKLCLNFQTGREPVRGVTQIIVA